jgi:hypothetical protein
LLFNCSVESFKFCHKESRWRMRSGCVGVSMCQYFIYFSHHTHISPSLSVSLSSIQDGSTALIWAAYKGFDDIVKSLLARKEIKINTQDKVIPITQI